MNVFLLLVQTLLAIAIAAVWLTFQEYVSHSRLIVLIVGIMVITSVLVSVVLLIRAINNRVRVIKRRVLLETPFGNIIMENDNEYKIEEPY